MRGGGGRRPGPALGLGLRQAHRLRVPAAGAGLGRVLPAQGHARPCVHIAERRGLRLRPLAGGHRGQRGPAGPGRGQGRPTPVGGTSTGAPVAVWGLTFKAGTDDRRNSPALDIARRLADAGRRRAGLRPHGRGRCGGARDWRASICGRPLRGLPGGPGGWCVLTEWDEFRWLDFAKVRDSWPPRRSSTPGTCSTRRALRRCGFSLHRHRPAVSRVVVAGGAGFLGSHLCDRLVGPGRRGGLRRRPLHRATATTWPTCSTGPGFTFVVADVSRRGPGRRTGRRGLQPGQPRLPAGLPGAAARRPWPWAARGPGACSSWPARTAPGSCWPRPARSTATRGPPPARDLPGQRRPDRAPQRLRRGQAVRRGADHGHATGPRAPTSASPGSSTPTGPRLAPATAGWCPTSSSRRWPASRSPSTATAPRPGASATSTTRSAGSLALLDSDHDRPGQHRQPRRAHRARAGPRGARGHRSDSPDRRSTRCRPTTRPGAARTSPWPDAARLGAHDVASTTGWPARSSTSRR